MIEIIGVEEEKECVYCSMEQTEIPRDIEGWPNVSYAKKELPHRLYNAEALIVMEESMGEKTAVMRIVAGRIMEEIQIEYCPKCGRHLFEKMHGGVIND